MYTIFILIIIIIIAVIILKKYNKKKENFECKNPNEEDPTQDVLSKSQKNQVKRIAKDQTMSLMNQGSQFMQGPRGTIGPQGVPGGEFSAAGRLVNQKLSYRNTKENAFLPNLVTTRTSGTIPSQSLLLMDFPTLASFQYWYLNKNNTIENKYDGTCITYNPLKSKKNLVYMGDCKPNKYNQWKWTKDNRLLLLNSESGKQQCLVVNNSDKNISTTNLPGCEGDKSCIRTGEKYYLKISDCSPNKIFNNQIWSFI